MMAEAAAQAVALRSSISFSQAASRPICGAIDRQRPCDLTLRSDSKAHAAAIVMGTTRNTARKAGEHF